MKTKQSKNQNQNKNKIQITFLGQQIWILSKVFYWRLPDKQQGEIGKKNYRDRLNCSVSL